jgi:hypothetical protein
MPPIRALLHVPGERRIVTFDFSTKLRTGAAIMLGAVATVDDPGIVLDAPIVDPDTGLVDVMAAGGVDVVDYMLECTVPTTDGEILIMRMRLECRRFDL